MSAAGVEQRAVDATLQRAHNEIGLTYAQIGALLRVSERTLRRWHSHAHAPQPRQRVLIEDLRRLQHVLAEVFPERGTRDEWLHSPSGLLRGRTPISLLRVGRISPVVEALATLESGAFT